MPDVPWLDPIYVKWNYFKEYVNNLNLMHLGINLWLYLFNSKVQHIFIFSE